MNHTLHHLHALWLRFRAAIACYVLAWAALTLMVWQLPFEGYWARAAKGLHWALTGLGAALLACALAQDPAAGSDSFWRTRPARWAAVWRSQLLFLLLAVAAPPLLCWAVNGLLMDNSPRQWLHGSLDVITILSVLFILAGVASFARSWHGLILSLIAGGLIAWGAGWVAHLAYGWTQDGSGPHEIRYSYALIDRHYFLFLAGLGICGLAAWVWGMRSSLQRERRLGISMLALILPPALFTGSGLLIAGTEPPLSLPVSARLRAGGQNLRSCVISYPEVPPRQAAVTTWSRLTPLDPRPGTAADSDGVISHSMGKSLPDSIAKDVVLAALPKGVTWHTTAGGTSETTIDLHGSARNSGQIRLTGSAGGVLVTPVRLASVPLVNGAAAASRGSHLHVRSLTNAGTSLQLTLEVRGAAGGREIVLPDSVPFTGYGEQRWFAVLHFPALRLAILCGESFSESAASWQSRIRTSVMDVALPLSEAVRGVLFDQTTLSGAEVIVFGLQAQGEFIATPDDSILKEPPPTSAPEKEIPEPVPSPSEALQLVRTSRVPLHSRVILAAADAAQPADYPDISRMVRMLPAGSELMGGAGDAWGLFLKLKSLPGFDWRSPVIDHWNRLLDPELGPHSGYRRLLALAALAGETAAMNKVAELALYSKPPIPRSQQETEILNELAAMIEGIPPDCPEREAWLLRRWGYFEFDAATGRYRAKEPQGP